MWAAAMRICCHENIHRMSMFLWQMMSFSRFQFLAILSIASFGTVMLPILHMVSWQRILYLGLWCVLFLLVHFSYFLVSQTEIDRADFFHLLWNRWTPHIDEQSHYLIISREKRTGNCHASPRNLVRVWKCAQSLPSS